MDAVAEQSLPQTPQIENRSLSQENSTDSPKKSKVKEIGAKARKFLRLGGDPKLILEAAVLQNEQNDRTQTTEASEIQKVKAPEKISGEIDSSAQEVGDDIIESLSLWNKVMEHVKEFSPGLIAAGGGLALQHLGQIPDGEPARFFMTVAMGGIAGIDGRELRNNIRHPNMIDKGKIAKSILAALWFSKACDAISLPLPDAMKGAADDLILPMMKVAKYIPPLSTKMGGVK